MKVRRGLRLYSVLNMVLCVCMPGLRVRLVLLTKVGLVAMYGMANNISGEVGCRVGWYDLLVGVCMFFNMLVVSSCCIIILLVSVYCVHGHETTMHTAVPCAL